jgi:hypothetical protein
MMNYRSVAQHTLALTLVLSLFACNFDSDQAPDALVNPQGNAVSLAISSPISSSSMDTTDEAVSLSGTASSDTGVYRVTWATDNGDGGVASGRETWHIANVDLALGDNKITVTAEDNGGATAERSIAIKRESGQTGSATLSWTAPSTREDGSPLTNLAGYKIYYGRMSEVHDYEIDIKSAGVSTYVVDGLVSGDWYFALVAYDKDGLESDRSNEVLRNIS